MKPADLAALCLLGGGLLAAGWQDWGTLRQEREHPPGPGFDLLRADAVAYRAGDAEVTIRRGDFLLAEGLAGVEEPGDGPIRHGYGPATRLVLRSEESREAVVDLAVFNGVAHQELVFRFDGKPLEELHDQTEALIERIFHLPITPGTHVFQVEYSLWNHHGAEPAPGDGRPLAATFGRLRVEFRPGEPSPP